MNETICPCDFQRAGQIVDDDLNARLVRRVPQGCILHALLDACHSGTGMDLPFVAMIDPRSNRMFWTDERGRCVPAAQAAHCALSCLRQLLLVLAPRLASLCFQIMSPISRYVMT